MPRRAGDPVADLQLRHASADRFDLADEAITGIDWIIALRILETKEEGAFGARADQGRPRAQPNLTRLWRGGINGFQRDLSRRGDDDSLSTHYFIPVVAMPVVMKRCRKAKTSVIGSSVTTVIAST